MLVPPFFSVLALAPLLQGLFDFPLQTAFQAVIFFACLLWFLSALRRGQRRRETAELPPLPQAILLPAVTAGQSLSPGQLPLFSRPAAAVLAAAALSFFSMLASPVRALVWPEWGNLAAGFLIFMFSGLLGPEERKKTNRALRIAAWGTAALVCWQAFVLKSPQISASLINPNALALFVLMILPLAVSWKDWWLAGAMFVILVWTQSAGAALALLAVSGLYARRSFGAAEFRKNLPLFVLPAIALALLISQVPPQSFVHRLLWWKSAFLMFLSKPFFGFGHAAFTFVYPAYRGLMRGAPGLPHHLTQVLGSIYAHSYYLEFLAENGIFCAALWFGLLVYAVKKKMGLAKYSLVAALVHSVIDFGLSVPANFWIFCYLAAPENQECAGTNKLGTPRACNFVAAGLLSRCRMATVQKTLKFLGIKLQEHKSARAQAGDREERAQERARAWALFPAAAIISVAWLNLCFTHNRALRAQTDAVSAYAGRDFTAAENKFKKALEIENGPVPLEALGKIEYRQASERKDRGMLFSSAVFFERALMLNPYSASAYRNLASVYRAAGEDKLLKGLEERKKAANLFSSEEGN